VTDLTPHREPPDPPLAAYYDTPPPAEATAADAGPEPGPARVKTLNLHLHVPPGVTVTVTIDTSAEAPAPVPASPEVQAQAALERVTSARKGKGIYDLIEGLRELGYQLLPPEERGPAVGRVKNYVRFVVPRHRAGGYLYPTYARFPASPALAALPGARQSGQRVTFKHTDDAGPALAAARLYAGVDDG
jgi:hypothetical protein